MYGPVFSNSYMNFYLNKQDVNSKYPSSQETVPLKPADSLKHRSNITTDKRAFPLHIGLVFLHRYTTISIK